MASCFRTDEWKDDVNLKEDLKRYVNQLYKRREILNFMEKDFPQYTWSVRTLDRRLRHFDIYYVDKDVDVDQVKEAVAKELEGPGRLLVNQDGHPPLPLCILSSLLYPFFDRLKGGGKNYMKDLRNILRINYDV